MGPKPHESRGHPSDSSPVIRGRAGRGSAADEIWKISDLNLLKLDDAFPLPALPRKTGEVRMKGATPFSQTFSINACAAAGLRTLAPEMK